jgi:hypothetical protein
VSIPTATQQGLLVLQVRAIIEFALQTKSFVNYLPLAKSLKVFSGGRQIAEALGSIMEEDDRAGRALTCALVVSSTSGLPGKGFFDKARALGYQFTDDQAFWLAQRQALGVTP